MTSKMAKLQAGLAPVTLGYDLGNQTVASTVINEDFNILKQHNKRLTSVTLFKEAKSAAERRGYRSHRRNLAHKRWLKKQLVRWFKKRSDFDVDKVVDAYKHSWVSKDDPDRKQPDIYLYLTDKQKYRTVWDAVDALVKNDQARLPETKAGKQQLVFEICYNFLGRRGHFLLPQLSPEQFITESFSFKDLGQKLMDLVPGLQIDLDTFDQIMSGQDKRADKRDALASLTGKNKVFKVVNSLILGYQVKKKSLGPLFGLDEAASDLQFTSSKLDEQLNALNQDDRLTDHDLHLIDLLHQIYSLGLLGQLIEPGKTFIESRRDDYDRFGLQLIKVKKMLRSHPDEKMQEAFDDYLNAYAGHGLVYSDFNNALKAYAKKVPDDVKSNVGWTDVDDDLVDAGQFMLKQRSSFNTAIPQQAIQATIRQIIDSQKEFWPELADAEHVDDPWFKRNHEVYDLERFYDFRVPYFIGPLVENADQSPWSWLVRREDGTLTVFNFTQKIDFAKSSQKFMDRLIGKDLYLLDQPVMAKSTLTYEKYKVLDELSLLLILDHGHKRHLSGQEKAWLISEDAGLYFKRDDHNQLQSVSSITLKHLFAALKRYGLFDGIDKKRWRSYIFGYSDVNSGDKAKLKNSFSTLGKLLNAGVTELQLDLHFNDLEQIITMLTSFDADSVTVKDSELQKYQWIHDDLRTKLANLLFDGWGRLSKQLLVGMQDTNPKKASHHNVIWYLENTSLTMMQILHSDQLGFGRQIEDHQRDVLKNKSVDQKIEMLLGPRFIAPAVKKSLRKFTSDLQFRLRQLKQQPRLVVIESARELEKQKADNQSRVNKLKSLKQVVNPSIKKLLTGLSSKDQKKMSDRFMLYVMQDGKDIYTGKPLLGGLNALSTYHVDHVVPQSFTVDNSLDNRVLTTSFNNEVKTNNVKSVSKDVKNWWKQLVHDGMMSKTKYQHLTTDWSKPDKVQHFLHRSLVETNQVNKLAAQIVHLLCPDSKVLMLNSSLTDYLRKAKYFDDEKLQEEYRIVKNRDVNDLHHGVDSYLIAFAGQYLYDLDRYTGQTNYQRLLRKTLVDGEFVKFKRGGHVDFGGLLKSGLKTVGQQPKLTKKLRQCQINQKMFNHVRYEKGVQLVGNILFQHTTRQPARKFGNRDSYLPIHKNLDPHIYGYYASLASRYFMIYQDTDSNYRIVWIHTVDEDKVKAMSEEQRNVFVSTYPKVKKFDHLVSNMLVAGTKLHAVGTNFNFRLPGSLAFTSQLMLKDADWKILDHLEDASVDELHKLIQDILLYERDINGYAASKYKQAKPFPFLFSNNFIYNQVLQNDDVDDLRNFVRSLLIGFHCNVKFTKLSWRGKSVNNQFGMQWMALWTIWKVPLEVIN